MNRASASPQQVSLRSTAGCQLGDGLDETACVSRTAEKVGRFLERLIVFKRHHDDGALIPARDDDRGMIVADLFHGFCQVVSRVCVRYGVRLVSLMSHRYR